MTRRKKHDEDAGEHADAPEAPQAAEGRAGTHRNGSADRARSEPAAEGAAGDGATSPTMHRAEEMVDRAGEKLGHYAGMIGSKLMWLVARAREEAEDVWAEAQALRQNWQRGSSGRQGEQAEERG